MKILQFPIMTKNEVHGDIARFYRKFREFAGDLDSKKSSSEAAVRCVRFCRAGIGFFAGKGDVASVEKIIDHFAVYLSEVVEAGDFVSTKQYSILEYVYEDDADVSKASHDERKKNDAAVKKYCHKGGLAVFKEADSLHLVKDSEEGLSRKEMLEQTRLVGDFFKCFVRRAAGAGGRGGRPGQLGGYEGKSERFSKTISRPQGAKTQVARALAVHHYGSPQEDDPLFEPEESEMEEVSLRAALNGLGKGLEKVYPPSPHSTDRGDV